MVVIAGLLRRLGLNKYETQAFIALTKIGPTTAFAVSKKSGVPFGRIYDSLNLLELKGLITVIPSKPKKYAANNPLNALNSLIDERLDELTLIRGEVARAVNELSFNNEQLSNVTVNTGRLNLSKRVDQHFNYSKELWATSEEFKLEKSHPAIHRYTEGKLQNEFLLVDLNKANKKRLEELSSKGLKYKHYPLKNVRILVSDEELVTISFKSSDEWINIQVTNKNLGKALTKLLRSAWNH